MSSEYVLTMTAANRAGILAAVTRAMSELDGDLQELSQTVVRGYFTMIFSAEFPSDLAEDVIRSHVEDTCRPFGIAVGLRSPVADGIQPHSDDLVVHTLRLGGNNRPGVLRAISSAISIHQADIVGMRAVRTRQSDGFEMVIKVAVPDGLPPQQLMASLTDADIDCSITVDLIKTH